MDELELRLAAMEVLLIDLLSFADKALLDRREGSLREGLAEPGEPGYGGDEYLIRKQAIDHVTTAKLWWKMFTGGTPIRPDA
jgi:hypothetical protein